MDEQTKKEPTFIMMTRFIFGAVFIMASAEGFNLFPINLVPKSANVYINKVTGGGTSILLIQGLQAIALLVGMSVLLWFYRKVFKAFLRIQLISATRDHRSEVIFIDDIKDQFPAEAENLRLIYSKTGS